MSPQSVVLPTNTAANDSNVGVVGKFYTVCWIRGRRVISFRSFSSLHAIVARQTEDTRQTRGLPRLLVTERTLHVAAAAAAAAAADDDHDHDAVFVGLIPAMPQ